MLLKIMFCFIRLFFFIENVTGQFFPGLRYQGNRYRICTIIPTTTDIRYYGGHVIIRQETKGRHLFPGSSALAPIHHGADHAHLAGGVFVVFVFMPASTDDYRRFFLRNGLVPTASRYIVYIFDC